MNTEPITTPEETLPPVELAQSPDIPDPVSRLEQREAAIALRERRFQAREHLLAMNLDEDILEHLDFSSDQALDASLRLVSLASKNAAAPVPLAAGPRPPAFGTYVERAKLFAEDPVAYRQMVGTNLDNN